MIDKVDKKLGSVEKEIRFDKVMILGSLAVIAVEVIVIVLSMFFSALRIPALIGVFFALICLYIFFIMENELKNDQAKAERHVTGNENMQKE